MQRAASGWYGSVRVSPPTRTFPRQRGCLRDSPSSLKRADARVDRCGSGFDALEEVLESAVPAASIVR
jgi:hypothetical protein